MSCLWAGMVLRPGLHLLRADLPLAAHPPLALASASTPARVVRWDGQLLPVTTPICACGQAVAMHNIETKKMARPGCPGFDHTSDRWYATATVDLPLGTRPRSPWQTSE